MNQWHAGCFFFLWRAIARAEGGAAMKPYASDALWERLQPLLPPPSRRRFRFPRREPRDYRQVLTGISFIFKIGIS
jgi:hypothetical protein